MVISTKGFHVFIFEEKQLPLGNEILWNTAISIATAQGTASSAVQNAANQHLLMNKQKAFPTML